MTSKITVASLPDFESAEHISDSENLKVYIQVVEEEKSVEAFREVLKTVFLAIGAHTVATASGLTLDSVWEVQQQPAQNLENLQKIKELLKKEVLMTNKAPSGCRSIESTLAHSLISYFQRAQ